MEKTQTLMNALVVAAAGRLELRQVNRPEPGPYDALVRVRACGICATTDRELIQATQPYHRQYPALLGHEAVGEVLETGARVRHLKRGMLVTRPCAIWPGENRDGLASCWGGFAEYALARDWRAAAEDGDKQPEQDYTMRRQNPVPEGLSPVEAVVAIALAETASWLHAHAPVAGQAVCVAGTGMAGLSIALWCKLAGATNVIVLGRRRERLELARTLCADHTIDVTDGNVRENIFALTGGAGVGFWADAVGQRDQISLGLSVLRPGGQIGIYGVAPGQQYELDWSFRRGNATIAHFSASEHLAYDWVCDLLRRRWIDLANFQIKTWPLHDFATAFSENARAEHVKSVVVFG